MTTEIIITDSIATQMAADLKTRLGNVKLHLFTGTKPNSSTALSGALGTPLATVQAVTADGGGKYGIQWDTPVALSRTLARLMTQACKYVGLSTGMITYAILTGEDDPLTASTSYYRLVMSVGTSGTDIVVDSVSVTLGITYAFSSALEIIF
jgi:hypothetical protein